MHHEDGQHCPGKRGGYEEALEVNEKRAAEEMEFEDESEAADDFQETPVSEV